MPPLRSPRSPALHPLPAIDKRSFDSFVDDSPAASPAQSPQKWDAQRSPNKSLLEPLRPTSRVREVRSAVKQRGLEPLDVDEAKLDMPPISPRSPPKPAEPLPHQHLETKAGGFLQPLDFHAASSASAEHTVDGNALIITPRLQNHP
mmetsp:Transcript_20084/g.62124  ORF Transcript_20084/g.62124 Transcript_20084/m.62124 type:complete len:147 (+) Transcript_20084:45-485(+)